MLFMHNNRYLYTEANGAPERTCENVFLTLCLNTQSSLFKHKTICLNKELYICLNKYYETMRALWTRHSVTTGYA